MKRNTVVRHLEEMAETAARLDAMTADYDAQTLRELWVGGDLVTEGADIEHVVVVLLLDLAADELPEIAWSDHEAFYGEYLRLNKRPMITRSRPVSRPAWSHLERRVARFWSAETGPDDANLAGLRTPGLDGATVVEPTDSDLRDWLSTELPRSEAHLRGMLDVYWEGSWCKSHTGGGFHPDDHLWRAAWAAQSMRDALTQL